MATIAVIFGSPAPMTTRPETSPERRLAAIFVADVAGYSRLMSENEVRTLRLPTAHREIADGLIDQHRGRIANTAGDSVLAEFPSAVDAVQCATAVQERLAEANRSFPRAVASNSGSAFTLAT